MVNGLQVIKHFQYNIDVFIWSKTQLKKQIFINNLKQQTLLTKNKNKTKNVFKKYITKK